MNTEIGKLYKHRKGRVYRVLTIACSTDGIDKRYVIYEDYRTGTIWARRKEEFEDGRFTEIRFPEEG